MHHVPHSRQRHQRRLRPPRPPAAVDDLGELDRESRDRIALLLEDHSDAASVAALWELRALAERGEFLGRVPNTVNELAWRWTR